MEKEKHFIQVPKELAISYLEGHEESIEFTENLWIKELSKEKEEKLAKIMRNDYLVGNILYPSIDYTVKNKEGKMYLEIVSVFGGFKTNKAQIDQISDDEDLSELIRTIDWNNEAIQKIANTLLLEGFTIRQYKEFNDLHTEISHPEEGLKKVYINSYSA